MSDITIVIKAPHRGGKTSLAMWLAGTLGALGFKVEQTDIDVQHGMFPSSGMDYERAIEHLRDAKRTVCIQTTTGVESSDEDLIESLSSRADALLALVERMPEGPDRSSTLARARTLHDAAGLLTFKGAPKSPRERR